MAKKKTAAEAVETAKEVVETAGAETKAKAPVIYVGPTMTSIGAVANTIYSDIPETAQAAFEQCPILKILFVNIPDYPQAEREIREQSGACWGAYEAAVEYQTEHRR